MYFMYPDHYVKMVALDNNVPDGLKDEGIL